MSFRDKSTKRFQGLPASPGIAMARALVHEAQLPALPFRNVEPGGREAELARFEEALLATGKDLENSRSQVADKLGEDHARIFEAHQLILADEVLVEQVRGLIREGMGAEIAWTETCSSILDAFRALPAELGDRSIDLRDVERKVLGKLLGRESRGFAHLTDEVIIVASDLAPSDTVTMDREKVRGFVLEKGGPASHSVILGRSLGIPVVTGVRGLMKAVRNRDPIILDGHSGQLTLHPDKKALQDFEDLKGAYGAWEREMLRFKDFPAETRDGRRIELLANIEIPEEVASARDHGAAGVGLYRTEYLFLTSQELPSEEQQYEAYTSVVKSLAPEPVILRSVDLGGDKIPSYLRFPQEQNPHLGWRGIRYTLSMEDIFRTQLRAILRASEHGQLRLMFPMVSSVEEIRQIKQVLAEVREELKAEGHYAGEDIQIGVMVETPAAVAIAHLLAREVDFLSIGTNDLIQFSLAIDRNNSLVSGLYDPFHPAILRQIRRTVKAGHSEKIWVGLCGELPEDPLFTILLMGMGLDEISTGPYRIPEIKRVIRSITHDGARQIVKAAWLGTTSEEVRSLARAEAMERFPDLADMIARGESA